MSLQLFIEWRLLCADQIERQGNPPKLETTDAQGVIAQHRASGDPRNRLGLGTCTVQPSWFLLAMLVRTQTFYFHRFNSGGWGMFLGFRSN